MYIGKYGAPPGLQDCVNGNFNSSNANVAGRLKTAVETGKKMLVCLLLGLTLTGCSPHRKDDFPPQNGDGNSDSLTLADLRSSVIPENSQANTLTIEEFRNAFVREGNTAKAIAKTLSPENTKEQETKFSLQVGDNKAFLADKGEVYQQHHDFVESFFNKGVFEKYKLENLSMDIFINLAVIESYLTRNIVGGNCVGYYQVDAQSERFVHKNIVSKDEDLKNFLKGLGKNDLTNPKYNTIIAYLFFRRLQQNNENIFESEESKRKLQENVSKNLPTIFKRVSKKLAGKGVNLDFDKFKYVLTFLLSDPKFLKAICDMWRYNGQDPKIGMELNKECKLYPFSAAFLAMSNEIFSVAYFDKGVRISGEKIS